MIILMLKLLEEMEKEKYGMDILLLFALQKMDYF
jgi:hypothetical protein